MARKPHPDDDPNVLDAFDIIAKRTGRNRVEVIETWSERAGIRQYLGNMSRMEAELKAIGDTEEMLTRR